MSALFRISKGGLAAGLLFLSLNGAQAVEVSVLAPVAVTNGATFAAALTVSNAVDLAGFQTVLLFDREKFDLLEIDPGTLLGDPNSASETAWRLPTLEEANATGAVAVAGVRLAESGVSGDGTLLTVRLRERAGGTYLSLLSPAGSDTLLADSTPASIPVTLRDAAVKVWGDGDADGLPDNWESANLHTLRYGPGDDPDGDGETLAAERAQGTDPLDARSAAEATNRYDRFRFELFRSALQAEAGATNETLSWGAELLCQPRHESERIVEASLAVPLPHGGYRTLALDISEDAGMASFQSTFDTFAAQCLAYPGGDYAARLQLTSGVVTQALRFAFSVPTYEEEDYPPFVPVETPHHGSNGVSRTPSLQFGDTNWTGLAILNAQRERVYATPGDGNAGHTVTQKLAAGRGYWLVAARHDTNGACLASRTWSGFATVFDLPVLLVQNVAGQARPDEGPHLFEPGSLVTNWVESSVQTNGAWYVSTGWNLAGNEPAAGVTNQFLFAITNNAVLTWLWSTNYWLEVLQAPHGVISAVNGWRPAGSVAELLATPSNTYHFGHWLLDPGGTFGGNPYSVTMNGPLRATAAFDPDLAALGTPHWWLASYGATNAGLSFDQSELANPDGDAHRFWQEYLADTDPTNLASCLAVTGIRLLPEGVGISWKGGAEAWQYLEASDSLTNASAAWRAIFTNPPPTAVTNSFIVGGATNSVLFYRIRAVRP